MASQQEDTDTTRCLSPEDGYREQKQDWDTPGHWDIGTPYANAMQMPDGLPSPLRKPHAPLNVERLCQLLEEARRTPERAEREVLEFDDSRELEGSCSPFSNGGLTDAEASPSWSPSGSRTVAAVDDATPPSPVTPVTPVAPEQAKIHERSRKRIAVGIETLPSPPTPATMASSAQARVRSGSGKRKLDDVAEGPTSPEDANMNRKRQKHHRGSTPMHPATCYKT
ncbi:hypothetical protein K4F52_010292 [Lecanicillium sp. MT-2017a]|nr:hypothetical protein K4F52_010292 [Lecanicillium sp. MT-2017a]